MEYWDKYFAKQKLNINSGEIFFNSCRENWNWLIDFTNYLSIYLYLHQTFSISSACKVSPLWKLTIVSRTSILIISNDFLLIIISKYDYIIKILNWETFVGSSWIYINLFRLNELLKSQLFLEKILIFNICVDNLLPCMSINNILRKYAF